MSELSETYDWVMDSAAKFPWRWASTYADTAPHAYVKPGMDPVAVKRLARLVWARGIPRRFYSNTNIELQLPELTIPFGPRKEMITGVKMWQMTGRLRKADLVNVAPITSSYGVQDAPVYPAIYNEQLFDYVSPEITDMWDARGHQDIGTKIWKLVQGSNVVEHLTDFGAGFGAALDMRLAPLRAQSYTAIEPSRGMMNQLIYRNPWVSDIALMDAGTFLAWNDRKFQTAVALLGSASYLTPEDIREIADRSRHAVFMHYMDREDDYFGKLRLPDHARASLEEAMSLPGAHTTRIGRFATTVVRK